MAFIERVLLLLPADYASAITRSRLDGMTFFDVPIYPTSRFSGYAGSNTDKQETVMAVDTSPRSTTWTYVDGEWLSGNPPLIGPTSHAMWLGSTVFDGARWFDGIAPDLDLHCQRVNRSALALGLKPVVTAEDIEALAWEGVKKFDGQTAIYIKPMYWGEHGMPGSVVAVDPDSTRFALCLFEAPMGEGPGGQSLTISPFRRPTIESMPTDAKAGCLYPNNGRILIEARKRGFSNALVRDMLGNIAETGSSNVFMVKDGVVFTPASNKTFLAGITRFRVIGLLRDAGFDVVETTLTLSDFETADEIFTSGNYSKVVPVTKLEDRDLQPGPIAAKAKDLYMDWAHSSASDL
jgi:branched-chain amino acid aminotransferase